MINLILKAPEAMLLLISVVCVRKNFLCATVKVDCAKVR